MLSKRIPELVRIAQNAHACVASLSTFVEGKQYKQGLLLTGRQASSLANSVLKTLSTSLHLTTRIGEKPAIATVDKILRNASPYKYDVIISVGGGSQIDLGKYIASKIGVDFVAIPTLLAHDGIASPVAVLVGPEGRKRSLPATMPSAVLVDLAIIQKAPPAAIRAGIGDLLANSSAIEDWKIAHEDLGEDIHDLACMMSYNAMQAIYRRESFGVWDQEFYRQLTASLILSGIAMEIAGSSRPASGSEHEISHALDELYKLEACHGEQVALASVLTTKLQGRDWLAYSLRLRQLGLPVQPTEIGLSNQEYTEAVFYAPKTRPERYTILERLRLSKKGILVHLKEIETKLAEQKDRDD